MELSQPEIIQIYRRRAGLNQGTLGAAAFDTSFESGRTKIKNIELGRQKPTQRDIENLARALKLPAADLLSPSTDAAWDRGRAFQPGIAVGEKTIERFPGLDAYLEMLNKAVLLRDEELIDYIAEKLAGLFTNVVPNKGRIAKASS